jgi:E3 ubiquitin-protein ligase makorin
LNTSYSSNFSSCPQCRVVSDFVIPSELWVEDDIEKEALIKQYQKNMKQKVCKYVKNDNADDCPFGNKCFYRHQRRDGTIIQSGPPRRRRHRSPSHYQNLSLEEFIRIVPNVNLIRVGIGEEDSLSYLFDEFQDIFDDFRYDYTTDEDDDVDDDLDALDDELFGLHLDDNID